MKTALITLSSEGTHLVGILAKRLAGSIVYIHEKAAYLPDAKRFRSIMELTAEIFPSYEGLIYVAPCGVVVRAITPHLKNKYKDPAVVAVDAGGRYAISLLSGHEGGANELAVKTANIIGGEPVITTTTEALKPLIVGIGCRRGIPAERIISAVKTALAEAGAQLGEVRFLASADVKENEEGLLLAARELKIPIRFIASKEIRRSSSGFTFSPLAAKKINLPAVAEPAALLAGRRTQLIHPRKTYGGITVAIAREGFTWSESGPAVP